MRPLRPFIPIAPDESLPSHVSRLALLHGLPSAKIFCQELGFSLRGLIDGREPDLIRLAELVAADPDTLRPRVTVERDDGWYLQGERFAHVNLCRSIARFCPRCIARDLTSGSGRHLDTYGRQIWDIKAIRTCADHGIALVEIPYSRRPLERADFARVVEPYLGKLDQLATELRQRPASGLELYIQSRLAGDVRPEVALNALPLYAVIHACELFGSVAGFSTPPSLHKLSDDEAQEAGGMGFDILSRGQEGVDAFLHALRSRHPEKTRALGAPNRVYGKIYRWLNWKATDPAYDPIRDWASRHILEVSRVGLRSSLFGRPIAQDRVWHSVLSASQEVGIGYRRLRIILKGAGYLAPDDTRRDGQAVFSAKAANAFLQDLKTAVSIDEAAVLLNISRPQTRALLRDNILKSFTARTRKDPIKLFRKTDIDRLLSDLLRNAKYVDKLDPSMGNIYKTCKRVGCSTKEIFELIGSGQLNWIGRLRGTKGIPSILIKTDEIFHHIPPDHTGALITIRAARHLGTHTPAVRALIRLGHLAEHRTQGRRGKWASVISKESLDEFERNFILLSKLRKLVRKNFQTALADSPATASIPPLTQMNSEFTSTGKMRCADATASIPDRNNVN